MNCFTGVYSTYEVTHGANYSTLQRLHTIQIKKNVVTFISHEVAIKSEPALENTVIIICREITEVPISRMI